MRYTLAVFHSRTEAFTFLNLLNSYSACAKIISTPRRISVSCGISIQFSSLYYKQATEILSRRKFDTFVGFFEW